jgi:hypothetical protein
MRAYHMLGSDMRSRNGKEYPWKVSETRTVKYANRIKICIYGYHSCAELGGLRDYLYGPVLCIVDVSEPLAMEDSKQVSASRSLIAAFDVGRQLREFACDCAARALDRVETRGSKVDPRSRAAIDVARQYARGDASKAALETAHESARQAVDAYAAAAADAAAYAAAREKEITWQRHHLEQLLAPIVEGVTA